MKGTLVSLCVTVALASVEAGVNSAPAPFKREAKRTAVPEIDLAGLRPYINDALFPLSPVGMIYDTADDAGRRMYAKGAAQVIAARFDPKREHLLYFRWCGSIHDGFTPRIEGEGKIVFTYRPGTETTQTHHTRLFVIPRGAKWEVRKTSLPPSGERNAKPTER